MFLFGTLYFVNIAYADMTLSKMNIELSVLKS
jgi:hypothetical protein